MVGVTIAVAAPRSSMMHGASGIEAKPGGRLGNERQETDRMTSTAQRATTDESFMERALDLAANGPARGANPQVGCVIVDASGAVIAEGWHRGAGTAHAEIDALSKLEVGAAHGATAIVSLEPCNHTGRTGPCAEALINAGIARVVYAVSDPGEHSGGGSQRLSEAGVDVTGGVLRAAAETFLGDWLITARIGRPLVTVKWASSLDGRAAASDGSSQWITGAEARADVHVRRAAHDGIAAGTGTVLADDPSLTARMPGGNLHANQPVPVVFGHRDVPADARIRKHPKQPFFTPGDDLHAELRALLDLGIRTLFVEGGPTLISSLIEADLVDSYVVYLAPTLLGGDRLALTDIGVGTIADARTLSITDLHRLGDDIVVTLRPKGKS